MSASQLVSILVPAYNAQLWIAETLQSALGQTHRNIEVIVVDDGSSDGTVDVIRSFADDRLRLIQQENKGACAARNRALAEARGDFIQYLDADDLLAPEKIELQLERLTHEPRGTVATCGWARFYDGDLAGAVNDNRHDWKDYADPPQWLIDSGLGRGTMPIHTWLIPRVVATEAGSWNESLRINQDGEYNARVVLASSRIAFVPEAMVYYRSGTEGSISRGDNRSALESLLEATDLIASHMLKHRQDAEVTKAVAGMYRHVSTRAYPDYIDISNRAETLVEQYGGSDRLPGGGRVFRIIRDTVGWKPALRIQSFYRSITRGG